MTNMWRAVQRNDIPLCSYEVVKRLVGVVDIQETIFWRLQKLYADSKKH